MSFCHVRSDAQEHLRILVFADGVGAGSGPERRGQTGDGRRMTDSGAMVDIVRLENSPEQLLHVVGIFVDAASAADAGDGIRTMLCDDFPEPACDEIKCFIPGCFAKLTVLLANQRCFEPILRIDEIVAKAALDAQLAIVRRTVLDGSHLDDLLALDMKVELAAHAAVRTGRADFSCFPAATLPLSFLFRQCADWAGFHALSAKNTVAQVIGRISARYHLAFRAAVTKIDGPVHDNFVTCLNAAAAQDAPAEISGNERISRLRWIKPGRGR